jgi:hypothetical protein
MTPHFSSGKWGVSPGPRGRDPEEALGLFHWVARAPQPTFALWASIRQERLLDTKGTFKALSGLLSATLRLLDIILLGSLQGPVGPPLGNLKTRKKRLLDMLRLHIRAEPPLGNL